MVAATSIQGPGLYEVYSVTVHADQSKQGGDPRQGMVMVDPGSDTTFIRHDFARQLGLVGKPCHFRLKVVDREARPIETSRYEIVVEDCQGDTHIVSALGLETITILPPDPDLTPLRSLAEHLPDAAFHRPQGDVDILLGLRDNALHGSTERQWGNLRLLKSPLGCGWSWRGTHPDLQHSTTHMTPSLSAEAYAIHNASRDQGEVAHLYHIQSVREFHELDELGTTPPPVCLRCKGCRDCTFRRRRLTAEEQDVVRGGDRGHRQAVCCQDGQEDDDRSAAVCCTPGSGRDGEQLRGPSRRSPSSVRNDGKLGGLGHATLGRSSRTAGGSPGPPLLHEVKLSGPVAGGPVVCRLRQEGKLALQHEVKLCGSGTGGGVFSQVRKFSSIQGWCEVCQVVRVVHVCNGSSTTYTLQLLTQHLLQQWREEIFIQRETVQAWWTTPPPPPSLVEEKKHYPA